MADLVTQPDATPTRKVGAAGVGGALATGLVFALQQFGIEVTPEAAAAIATLASFVLGYLAKERKA